MENFKTSSALAYLAAVGWKSSTGPSSALTNSSESLLSAIIDGTHPKLYRSNAMFTTDMHVCAKIDRDKIFVGQ